MKPYLLTVLPDEVMQSGEFIPAIESAGFYIGHFMASPNEQGAYVIDTIHGRPPKEAADELSAELVKIGATRVVVFDYETAEANRKEVTL